MLLDEHRANEASDVFWGVVADAFKYSNENDSSSEIPPDRSLKDFFVEKLEEKELEEADKKIVLQMAQMWGAFIGDPLERQSLKYFWLEECIDGGKPITTLLSWTAELHSTRLRDFSAGCLLLKLDKRTWAD